MAHAEAGSREWVSPRGVPTESSTWAERLQQAASQRLEPMLLCGLDLAILGLGRYDCKPWRPWVMWLGGLHGCIDDGGPGKLTLRAALSDPLLDLLEDVGDVEGQMVRRGRPHPGLCPAPRGILPAKGPPIESL